MRVLYCLFFVLFAAMPAVGQEAADPTKLLGITYDLFRQSHPDDCNMLRAARYANESKNGSLEFAPFVISILRAPTGLALAERRRLHLSKISDGLAAQPDAGSGERVRFENRLS